MASRTLYGSYLGLIAAISCLALGANASEVSYTNSTTVFRTDLDWASQEQGGVFASISLPEFDSALGELQSVELFFLGRLDASGLYQFAFTGGPTTNVAVDIGMIYDVGAGDATVRERDFLVTGFGSSGGDFSVPCCEPTPIDFPRVRYPEFDTNTHIFDATDSDFESFDFSRIEILPQQYIQNITPSLISTSDEVYEITFNASVTYTYMPVPEPNAMWTVGLAVAACAGRNRPQCGGKRCL